MGFAIVMIVLVVAAVVWLVPATRADGRPPQHVQPWQRSDRAGPGAYTTGTFGGQVDSGGSSGCDSGGRGAQAASQKHSYKKA